MTFIPTTKKDFTFLLDFKHYPVCVEYNDKPFRFSMKLESLKLTENSIMIELNKNGYDILFFHGDIQLCCQDYKLHCSFNMAQNESLFFTFNDYNKQNQVVRQHDRYSVDNVLNDVVVDMEFADIFGGKHKLYDVNVADVSVKGIGVFIDESDFFKYQKIISVNLNDMEIKAECRGIQVIDHENCRCGFEIFPDNHQRIIIQEMITHREVRVQ